MGGVLIKKKMKFLLVPIRCLTILLFARNIITENFSSRISQKSWVTVEPEEAEDVLLNPGKGFVYYDWPLQQDEELIKKIVSVGYARFNWIDIEPEEGVYNWELIDSYLEKYRSLGKKFAFGVMNANVSNANGYITPKWVIDAGAEGKEINTENSRQVIPNWRDPVFLEKVNQFVKALADRYDGNPDIAFIDIRSYGNWGEQHLYGLEEAGWPDLTGEELRTLYMMPYIRAFRNTMLVNPWGKEEYNKEYEWALKQGVTLRRDGVMMYTDGLECAAAYGQLPAIFEFAASYTDMLQNGSWKIDTLENSLKNGKPSYMQISADMYMSDPQYFLKLANRLGYYFRIKQAKYPESVKAGRPISLQLTFSNEGLTPCYEPAFLYVAILDEAGSICYLERTEATPGEWLPGQTCTESITLEKCNLPEGTYRLAVGLLNGQTDEVPDYLFGNMGNTGTGWYEIGNIQITQ